MASGDPAFGRTMGGIVPRAGVLPYQPLDGEAVVLRATLTVILAPLLGAAGESVGGPVAREVSINLFGPPQRAPSRSVRARRLSPRPPVPFDAPRGRLARRFRFRPRRQGRHPRRSG